MLSSMMKQYYINKARKNRADNERVGYLIQLYNDRWIDDIIHNQNNNDYFMDKPTFTRILNDLIQINTPLIAENYQELMKNSFIDIDNLQRMLLRNKMFSDTRSVSNVEAERIWKNIQYVNTVLDHYDIPLDYYEQKLRQQSLDAMNRNRKQLIEDSLIHNHQIRRVDGLNSHVHGDYRNPYVLSENLMRGQRMKSQHEFMLEQNRVLDNQGRDILGLKTWVWTGRGKTTRHRSNDGQKVRIDDKFLIINDSTGETDYMDYPHDMNARFTNAGICYCEVHYSQD